jgi:hypothetical protein
VKTRLPLAFVSGLSFLCICLLLGSCARQGASGTPEPTATPAFWPTGMPPPTRGPTAFRLPTPKDERSCKRAGGEWYEEFVFEIGEPGCYRYRTTDAGKLCSDSGECLGWCDPNLTWEGVVALPTSGPGGQTPMMTGTCSSQANQRMDRWWFFLVDGGVRSCRPKY